MMIPAIANPRLFSPDLRTMTKAIIEKIKPTNGLMNAKTKPMIVSTFHGWFGCTYRYGFCAASVYP